MWRGRLHNKRASARPPEWRLYHTGRGRGPLVHNKHLQERAMRATWFSAGWNIGRGRGPLLPGKTGPREAALDDLVCHTTFNDGSSKANIW